MKMLSSWSVTTAQGKIKWTIVLCMHGQVKYSGSNTKNLPIKDFSLLYSANFLSSLYKMTYFSVKSTLSVSVLYYYFLCSGNIYPGEAPYETGTEVCTQCPSDKPYCKANLCCECKERVYYQLALNVYTVLKPAHLYPEIKFQQTPHIAALYIGGNCINPLPLYKDYLGVPIAVKTWPEVVAIEYSHMGSGKVFTIIIIMSCI